jgi:hypothetical protein
VGGDSAGGQEHAVGDLAVGQAVACEDDDLALLRGELVKRARYRSCGFRGHAAGSQFRFGASGPGRGAEAAEGFQGGREDGLGVVDPPLPPQPLPVVEAQLGPLERPGVPGGIGQALAKVSLGTGGVGEQPAGAGRELLQPWPGFLVRLGQRALQEGACLKVTLRADRGGGKVGDAEVGDVMVQRGAVGAKELAQLRVGGQVAALGQGRDPPGMLGPAGEPAVFGCVDAGQRTGQERPHLVVVTAHGEHGGRSQVGRGGDRLHSVGGGRVAGLAGGGERLIPSPTVNACPLQRRQRGPAAAADAGSAQPAERFPQQPDRELSLVQKPGRRADLGYVVDRSAGDPVQVGDNFGSTAISVGASRPSW